MVISLITATDPTSPKAYVKYTCNKNSRVKKPQRGVSILFAFDPVEKCKGEGDRLPTSFLNPLCNMEGKTEPITKLILYSKASFTSKFTYKKFDQLLCQTGEKVVPKIGIFTYLKPIFFLKPSDLFQLGR